MRKLSLAILLVFAMSFPVHAYDLGYYATGGSGGGSGDMLAATYDPFGIATEVAFASTSIVAGVGLDGGGILKGPIITLDISDTTVTPGLYTVPSITVNAQGQLTAAASGVGSLMSPGTVVGELKYWTGAVWANTGTPAIYDSVNGRMILQGGSGAFPAYAFGDGTYGFYAAGTDNIKIHLNVDAPSPDVTYVFFRNYFATNNTGGPALLTQTSTDTLPNIISHLEDEDTGLGHSGANEMSLIAAGVETARVTSNAVEFNRAISITRSITPPVFSATQNDFQPTDYLNATIWRIGTDNGVPRSITGITAIPARVIYLQHVTGSASIVLQNENGGSLPANRFILSAATLTMSSGGCMQIRYDSNDSRWRVLSTY